MKYCLACQRNVTPVKEFNWLVFLFLCGLFYLPVYLLKKPHCPMCHGTDFAEARQTVG